MKTIDSQTDIYLSERTVSNKAWEAGQLRRTKMHTSRLIDTIDNKKVLTPSLRELLAASLILETTNTKTLSAYLKRSPSTIRSQFQQIHTAIGKHDKNLGLPTTKDRNYLST